MKIENSPTTHHTFNGFSFYLKRDDQLHPTFSGNKARKFRALLDGFYPNITTIIGYGSPQANSLYSLAALAKLRGWKCEFYVNHIASFIKEKPTGNYAAALALGAKVIDISESGLDLPTNRYISDIRQPDQACLVVPEGGRCALAEYGVTGLAKEIIQWKEQQKISNLVIALPSGTGTTAFYLHRYLKNYDIEVLTCPCVGGETYLTEQFKELNCDSSIEITADISPHDYPTILTLKQLNLNKKHHFGKLYHQDYLIWQQLNQQTTVEFELLYDPLMWRCLMEWLPNHQDKTLLYIHQGGLLGNATMLPRYQRKYPNLNTER
ncbi:pyridoxal-phosphate dependent enzyme [Vibrio sp. SS-MA-C1-2]|uniref:pyridoxal-phosphate dependent enzyme n=1 Tax=Vibrio sp. SS-MA-C1-2 TaxID=2908646 RepID=UPI001F15B773|nr:pyridoxal-phosphate dependent enzyme [Vibrio sp. SS-MA-C1-2]UJF17369.1 pyridoxal-phosphate dependent enzyme [Vibrio sp. SS-MA-C1-2]